MSSSRESTKFQSQVVEKLRNGYSLDARKEWDVSKNSTDCFTADGGVYAPRIDIAVGPFSIDAGNKREKMSYVFENCTPPRLRRYVNSLALQKNKNPRCMMAIEVSYSGSSKHFLGDITNASMMGLYGIVIANDCTLDRLNRIFEYVKIIKDVDKAHPDLFSNVCILSNKIFSELLES